MRPILPLTRRTSPWELDDYLAELISHNRFQEDSMPRAIRTLTIAVSLLTAIAGAPRSTLACSNPFPPGVGASLTATPTGFQIMIFGGTAFGSLPGAGCGCAVGLP